MEGKRGRGETYQLIQIPTANLHVPLILVHALGEALGICVTRTRATVPATLVLGIVGAVGWSPRRVINVGRLLLLLLGRGTGSAEYVADGVADG